jgi:hypothetical protein
VIVIANTHLGSEPWGDLTELEREGNLIYVGDGEIEVRTIDNFTVSGAPVALVRTALPDGRVVVQEISARLLMSVAAAFRGRYGDL